MRIFDLDGEKYSISVPWEKDVNLCQVVYYKSHLRRDVELSFLADTGRTSSFCQALKEDDFSICPIPKSRAESGIGFRPFMRMGGWPFDEQGPTFGLRKGTVRKMFSLLVDDKPVQVSSAPPVSWSQIKADGPGKISFSDKYYGRDYLLPWVFVNDFAICAINVLTDISWDELNRQCYI